MDAERLHVNSGKELVVRSDGAGYSCYAIKTKIVTYGDALGEIVREYVEPVLEDGDILFISEKMIACSQGRAVPVPSINPGPLARFLSKFVSQNNAGANLAVPESMQCAINECGTVRILFSAVAGAMGKALRKKGWFYKVAGYRAACIDAPSDITIPPFNKYVVLAPRDPEKTASEISDMLGGADVLIVDINDIGTEILGRSAPIDEKKMRHLLRQNPLGQSCESTPMGILRPLST